MLCLSCSWAQPWAEPSPGLSPSHTSDAKLTTGKRLPVVSGHSAFQGHGSSADIQVDGTEEPRGGRREPPCPLALEGPCGGHVSPDSLWRLLPALVTTGQAPKQWRPALISARALSCEIIHQPRPGSRPGPLWCVACAVSERAVQTEQPALSWGLPDAGSTHRVDQPFRAVQSPSQNAEGLTRGLPPGSCDLAASPRACRGVPHSSVAQEAAPDLPGTTNQPDISASCLQHQAHVGVKDQVNRGGASPGGRPRTRKAPSSPWWRPLLGLALPSLADCWSREGAAREGLAHGVWPVDVHPRQASLPCWLLCPPEEQVRLALVSDPAGLWLPKTRRRSCPGGSVPPAGDARAQ